ncbi:MAG: type IV pili methyl-accepting chemotaxis transducer N-terminal domain-containing protein [Pseudomonadota bacterium]
MLQSDAYTLQIAARQRTLSQQIAKESCAVLTGNTVMGSRVRLTKSTVRFDASMQALINGFAGAGVSAPATPEIRDALTATAADWSAVRDQLLAIDASQNHDQAADLFDDLNSIMQDFDALIPMYIASSKSGL